MGSTIEKNDVDLSKLFNYGDKFSITDRSGKEVVVAYIRLVGDAELNKARTFALRCSAEFRNKLKDVTSEENKAYMLGDYSDIKDNELVDMIASYSYQRLAKEALKEATVSVPKEPVSDAPLEEQEKYQKEVDNYPIKKMNAVKEKVEELLEELKKVLKKMKREELIKEYETVYINSICEQEMLNKFREMCAYFGCYKDKHYKNKMFSSYETFSNVLPEIKKQIIENYSSVEITSDELKK
jgi:hypothetical protein